MSLRPGAPAKGAPAHQNTFAFRHQKHSKKTEKIMSIPNVGVCRRCHEQIEWRRKYRRYKPISAPTKCHKCLQKTVRYAYHTVCGPCAKEHNCCAKCEAVREVVQEKPPQLTAEEADALLSGFVMKERVRRTLAREIDRGRLDPVVLRDSLEQGKIPDLDEIRKVPVGRGGRRRRADDDDDGDSDADLFGSDAEGDDDGDEDDTGDVLAAAASRARAMEREIRMRATNGAEGDVLEGTAKQQVGSNQGDGQPDAKATVMTSSKDAPSGDEEDDEEEEEEGDEEEEDEEEDEEGEDA